MKAADYTVDVTKPEEIAKAKSITYQPGDLFEFSNITIPDDNKYIFEQRYDFYAGRKYLESRLDYLSTCEFAKGKPYTYTFYFPDADAWGYSNVSIEYQFEGTSLPIEASGEARTIIITTVFKVIVHDNDIPVSSEDFSLSKSVGAPSHECNFQWVTTIDPTTGADGLEQYKCTGCGVVKESHSIPASVAVIKDFYGNIKEAPENGSITYDSGKLYTISDYLLKKMSERSDVSVTVNFEYQNAKYELTFPAGTDFTPVLTDEELMYGYFGVAAKLGLTVVAK